MSLTWLRILLVVGAIIEISRLIPINKKISGILFLISVWYMRFVAFSLVLAFLILIWKSDFLVLISTVGLCCWCIDGVIRTWDR